MTAGVWVALVVGVLGGGSVGAVIAALVNARSNKASDAGVNWQAYTDDLSNRLEAQDAKIAAQDAKIELLEQQRAADAREREAEAEKRLRAIQHIGNLELHIIAGKAPPPPARPEGLI